MLEETIAQKINEQIGREFYSAYLYLDFANYYENVGLSGFAHWYEVQAQEERDHALMLRRYLLDSGAEVRFVAVDAPAQNFGSNLEPLAAGLEHERFVTACITAIYHEAFTRKDYKTMQFLDWFIKEQGEEEKNAEDLVKKMKLFGGDAKGLYTLDRELAARVYTPSATGPAV